MKRNRAEDEEEDEEEEKELLINVKVIEYLQPLMSKELLCKFPDNSAFDFNYSQSSIWSPLIPRTYSSMDLDNLMTPIRKLSSDFEFDKMSIKNKIAHKKIIKKSPAFKINLMDTKKKKKKKKIKASEFSPSPFKNSCLPIASIGWAKMLKAASKHFKKKKKDAGKLLMFTNCLRESKQLNQ